MSKHSAPPGMDQTADKAFVSAALAFIVAFATFWIADNDPFTAKEAAAAFISGLVSAGLIGGGSYSVSNRPKFDSSP